MMQPVADLDLLLVKSPGFLTEQDPKTGNQALHIAAQNGHLEITKWLKGKGADVNCQNQKGQTPLHMSIAYDCFEQTKFLLAEGADAKVCLRQLDALSEPDAVSSHAGFS